MNEASHVLRLGGAYVSLDGSKNARPPLNSPRAFPNAEHNVEDRINHEVKIFCRRKRVSRNIPAALRRVWPGRVAKTIEVDICTRENLSNRILVGGINSNSETGRVKDNDGAPHFI